MVTKDADIAMCGCSRSNVRHARPVINNDNFVLFAHFIKERYRIHKRKDTGEPRPWTKDPILQQYKFTNVRREHDYQTRRLIELVSTNPELSLEDKIVNTFMFRCWNNADTFEFFNLPQPARALYEVEAKERARKKLNYYCKSFPTAFAKRKWWSNAYNQGGTKYAWKFPDGDGFGRAPSEAEGAKHKDYEPDIVLRVFHIPVWLRRGRIVDKILAASTQQEVFDVIESIRGFSGFMAYQVFVDLTYIPEFPFSENEFTIAGPGCRKGIDRIFKDRDGLTYEECIFWIRDNFARLCHDYGIKWNPKKLFNDLPKYDRCLNVMSLENCFCEISKYLRTYYGEGRPRMKYVPREEN